MLKVVSSGELTEIPAHNAVPCGVVSLVKVLLDVGRDVLLHCVLVQGLLKSRAGQTCQSQQATKLGLPDLLREQWTEFLPGWPC